MTEPYYADDNITLYLGDCREVTEWLTADVFVFDPPYGRQSEIHDGGRNPRHARARRPPVANDSDTSVRDACLALVGDRPVFVFGSPDVPPPAGWRHRGVYVKPPDSGVIGSTLGWRRDVEEWFLLGEWPPRPPLWSSVLATATRAIGGPSGPAARYGHPHAKPVDMIEVVVSRCPPGVIGDPTAGVGSTLVAARNLGRRAIGVEVDERYCEVAARRLSQDVLPLGM